MIKVLSKLKVPISILGLILVVILSAIALPAGLVYQSLFWVITKINKFTNAVSELRLIKLPKL